MPVAEETMGAGLGNGLLYVVAPFAYSYASATDGHVGRKNRREVLDNLAILCIDRTRLSSFIAPSAGSSDIKSNRESHTQKP